MSFGISTDKFMSVELKNVLNTRVDLFDIGDPQKVTVSGGKSWARATDGAVTIAALDPTPGNPNDKTEFSNLKIYINEVNSTVKWIEIYNDENSSKPVGGYTVTRYNNDGTAGIATIPLGISIPSKGFLVIYQGSAADSPVGGAIDCLPYEISTEKFMSAVLRDDGNRIVDNTFNIGDPQTVTVSDGKSWARRTDGAANIVALTPSPGLSNNTVTDLISGKSENVLAYVHAGMLILPEKTSYIQLYSVSGTEVLSQNVTATSVDLTNLPKGFYVVKLTISGISYTQKIVLY
jgi:hypothetical protein